MRGPVEQAGHVAYEIGYFIFAALSRAINAVFFQGSMHQTLSARAHMESGPYWERIERRINRVFFLQKDHCANAWESEVIRAIKTLQRNGEM